MSEFRDIIRPLWQKLDLEQSIQGVEKRVVEGGKRGLRSVVANEPITRNVAKLLIYIALTLPLILFVFLPLIVCTGGLATPVITIIGLWILYAIRATMR